MILKPVETGQTTATKPIRTGPIGSVVVAPKMGNQKLQFGCRLPILEAEKPDRTRPLNTKVHLNKAENILIKTTAKYKEEHMLDDGKFSHCYILTDFVILYIGHEVNHDMAVLVGLWKFPSFALPDSSL